MKRRDDSVYKMLRDAWRGNPIAKQQDRLDAAVKHAAQVQGDVLVARTMRDHFALAAAKINHTQKWWEYAATRQKAQDYAEEYDVLVADHEAAVARVVAEQARMLHLHDGLRDISGQGAE